MFVFIIPLISKALSHSWKTRFLYWMEHFGQFVIKLTKILKSMLLALIDYEKMVERLRNEGVTLEVLPWAGRIYFIHGKNLSSGSWHSRNPNKMYFEPAVGMRTWFRNLPRLLALRPITKSITEEFNFFRFGKIVQGKP